VLQQAEAISVAHLLEARILGGHEAHGVPVDLRRLRGDVDPAQAQVVEVLLELADCRLVFGVGTKADGRALRVSHRSLRAAARRRTDVQGVHQRQRQRHDREQHEGEGEDETEAMQERRGRHRAGRRPRRRVELASLADLRVVRPHGEQREPEEVLDPVVPLKPMQRLLLAGRARRGRVPEHLHLR
jgi:hypothetical protein